MPSIECKPDQANMPNCASTFISVLGINKVEITSGMNFLIKIPFAVASQL